MFSGLFKVQINWLSAIILLILVPNLPEATYEWNGFRGQLGEESLANLAFSIRSSLERYENGGHNLQVRLDELYSPKEGRASLEMVQVDKSFETLIGRTLESARVRYYHETKFDLWLSLSDQGECKSSDRVAFLRDLSARDQAGDPLQLILSTKLPGDTPEAEHIVGNARLLLIIEQQKVNFARPQMTSAGGVEAVKFSFQMELANELMLEFDVYYNQIVSSTSFRQQQQQLTIPFFVRVQIPSNNSTLLVNYYSFKRLDTVVDPNNFQSADNYLSSVTFPLRTGCASVLTNHLPSLIGTRTAEDELLERTSSSVERVSFRANLFDVAGKNYAPSLVSREEYYFAFDLANKLTRRDHFRPGDTWKMIYDFNQGTFYQACEKKFDHSTYLDNHLELTSQVTGMDWDGRSCLIGEIANNQNHWEFINFQRLQFMGFGRLNGQRVRIFEDDTSDRLPFWLQPSVSARYSEQPENRYEELAGHLNGDHSAVYYFAAPADQQTQTGAIKNSKLGPLMRIDFQIRDPKRDLILLWKRLEVNSFRWNQLASPVNSASDGSSVQDNVFALSDHCQSGGAARKWATHLKMLLRPLRANEEQLQRWPSKSEPPAGMNEILIGAINSHFGLSRLYIDHLSSQLLLAASQRLPEVALQLELSHLPAGQLKPIGCLYLGRGQFMRSDEVWTLFAPTFEDCLVQASRSHKSHTPQRVLFAYNAPKFQCLIDKLYKANKELNYLDFQFGRYAMFTIETASQQSTSRNTDAAEKKSAPNLSHLIKGPEDSPLISNSATSLIGTAIELPLLTDLMGQRLALKYALKFMRLSGGDSTRFKEAEEDQYLAGLGWRWLGEGDQFVWSLREDTLSAGYKTARATTSPAGPMSTSVCRSLCSADLECRSYSFCERLGSARAECSLSRVELVGQVSDQLADILSGKTNSSARRTTIWPQTSQQSSQLQRGGKKVGVTVSKRCSISGRQYLDSFKRAHREQLDLGARQEGDLLRVDSARACARLCSEHNLAHLRSSMRQRLDLKAAQEDLIKVESAQAVISVEKIESILDWRRQNSRNLCVHFHYAQGALNESSICLLPDSSKKNALHSIKANPSNKTQLTSMDMYKLIHVKLYDRTFGFRLRETTEPEVANESAANFVEDLRRLIEGHQLGSNRQILVNIDDAEHCARACTLQTHGPRPSCASFDFVYESASNISTGRKYCLLNSQSLHQLQRKHANLTSDKSYLLYARDGFQYWHYEPAESLLMSLVDSNMENSIAAEESSLILLDTKLLIDRLNAVLTQKNGSSKAKVDWMLYLFVVLAGVGSGLALGTRPSLLRKLGNDDQDRNVKNSVIRLVHRLSGVSLCSNLQQSEVRM